MFTTGYLPTVVIGAAVGMIGTSKPVWMYHVIGTLPDLNKMLVSAFLSIF